MKIGELASLTETDIDTIRYYEKVGVMPLPTRQANGYRVYGETHVTRLNFVRYCRALDISLADIKCLIDFESHPDRQCGAINQLIDAHLAKVRQRINELLQLELELEKLRHLCGKDATAAECGILQGLVSGSCLRRKPPAGEKT